ncbi:MAG: competence/damage-inducible protein A [bacterium]
MNIELIVIGDEILLGQISEGHTQWIGRQLGELGLRLSEVRIVGDRVEMISEAVKSAWSRADVVILTGGLGPTPDDCTRFAISSVLGRPLVTHTSSQEKILERFRIRGVTPTAGWEVMAMVPEGSEVLPNDHGAAPGFLIIQDNRLLFVLPGVPSEMQPMFRSYVIPHLKNRRRGTFLAHTFYTAGAGEAYLAELIGPPDQLQPAQLAYLPSIDNGVRIRVEMEGEEEMEVEAILKERLETVRHRIKDYIFAEEPQSLEEVVLKMLTEKGWRLALAESCTGGLLASRLISVPGASEVVDRGFITYSNESKMEELGVDGEIIERYGAVSEECARSMAEGARKYSGGEMAISITGIAGPTGGSPTKPVGLVFIGISHPQGTEVFRHQFVGDREENRRRSAWAALVHLWQILKTVP